MMSAKPHRIAIRILGGLLASGAVISCVTAWAQYPWTEWREDDEIVTHPALERMIARFAAEARARSAAR